LGISEFVTFAGFRKDFLSILKSVDIFVNPSLSEGLPNVVLEALAMGKPVVATAVGGVPELILPNTTGILIEAGNSKALAQGVLDLLNNPDQAQKMGNEGMKLVQKSFSLEDQNEKLEKLYLEV
jgi:glycosyltransferase involved in cell wall biosynthesis